MKIWILLLTQTRAVSIQTKKPLVVGHRGSCANTPEHTLVSYQLAIDQGADYIEPDLVLTKDGYFIARHENEISTTTDIESRLEFLSKRTTKIVDGITIEGWFTEDLTLSEIKKLRAKERIPDIRPGNTIQNGHFQIPTFQEIIDLVKRNEKRLGKRIGIYPETKHPSYFKSIGLPMEDQLIAELHDNGYHFKEDPVMIQSFEVWNLKYLRKKSLFYLVQLVNMVPPFDWTIGRAPNRSRGFRNRAQFVAYVFSNQGLKEIAEYADAISPFKDAIIPRNSTDDLGIPTRLVQDAHDVGLAVHTWTMRPENFFLPRYLRSSIHGYDRGDSVSEIKVFIDAGVDAFFTDSPDYGRKAVDV